MKIVIMTIPMRKAFDGSTPFGSLAIIQSLREAGYSPHFLDVATLRQPFDEVEAFFREFKPDVVGISAVVSTSYRYVRDITKSLREMLPNVRIVVGGNLCASAEVLLRSCHVDSCVLGEGEIVAQKLVAYYKDHARNSEDYALLKSIKGLAILDEDDEVYNTGYEKQILPDQIRNPDFSIIEEFSDMSKIIHDRPHLFINNDPRSSAPHRKGKKEVVVYASKGCTNKCTFCHRWIKGLRVLPTENTLSQIKHLIDNYDVGYLRFADECFGAHKRKTAELVAELKKLNVLWAVGGVRVDTVDEDILRSWREAGCTAVNYGIESGSQDILTQMEKNASLEQNRRAIDILAENNIYSVLQLVIGMPAETPATIRDTAHIIRHFIRTTKSAAVSINFAQALPGTPLYEYARAKGIIGNNWEAERDYLLKVSNKNAADYDSIMNLTQYSLITLRCWMYSLYQEVERTKREVMGTPPLPGASVFIYLLWLHSYGPIVRLVKRALRPVAPKFAAACDQPVFESDIGRSRVLYPIRSYLNLLIVLRSILQTGGFRMLMGSLWEHAVKSIPFRRTLSRAGKSLRKEVSEIMQRPTNKSEMSMEPLRRGR